MVVRHIKYSDIGVHLLFFALTLTQSFPIICVDSFLEIFHRMVDGWVSGFFTLFLSLGLQQACS